jgi:GT2 family glycosyltransferase
MPPVAAPPKLSVVIVSWNTRDILRECLASLVNTPHGVTIEVVVVDNDSADGSADMVATEFQTVLLLRNRSNDGFARGSNLGIQRSSGENVVLLNSDTRVEAGALGRLAETLDADPGCGACGAQLVNPDGTVQRACMRFPNLLTPLVLDTFFERWFPGNRELRRYFMRDWSHDDSREVEQPPGNGLAVPRRVLEQIGPLDERFFIFFVDVDLCRRLKRAGHRIRFRADARIVHHLGKSTAQLPSFPLIWQKDRLAYYRKYHGRWTGPYLKLVILLRAAEAWLEMRRRLGKGEALAHETKKLRGVVGQLLRA